MKHHEIEAWALDVIRRVEADHPNEDSRVELKADWPDAQKAARQIAGHANAARGTPILWLIGVDEKIGVKGASDEELANWGSKFESCFDELAPEILDLNIPVRDKTVVALFIETDRAPFVIKNPEGGQVQREVPWREYRSTKTATRSDLILLLSPLQSLPSIEILTSEMSVRKSKQNLGEPDSYFVWHLLLRLYIFPRNGESAVIPFHRCYGSFRTPGLNDQIELSDFRISPPRAIHPDAGSRTLSLTIESTNNEVLIEGPGKAMLSAKGLTPSIPDKLENDIELSISLSTADLNSGTIPIVETIEYVGSSGSTTLGEWKSINNSRYL